MSIMLRVVGRGEQDELSTRNFTDRTEAFEYADELKKSGSILGVTVYEYWYHPEIYEVSAIFMDGRTFDVQHFRTLEAANRTAERWKTFKGIGQIDVRRWPIEYHPVSGIPTGL